MDKLTSYEEIIEEIGNQIIEDCLHKDEDCCGVRDYYHEQDLKRLIREKIKKVKEYLEKDLMMMSVVDWMENIPNRNYEMKKKE